MASNEKVRIRIKGYEHSIVDAAAAKIVDAAKRGGARVAGPIPLPTDKEVVTILRAVHKYKVSREQSGWRCPPWGWYTTPKSPATSRNWSCPQAWKFQWISK